MAIEILFHSTRKEKKKKEKKEKYIYIYIYIFILTNVITILNDMSLNL